MGTEILRPQDCLIERMGVSPAVFPRRKAFPGNVKANRRPVVRAERSDQKRRGSQSEGSISKRSSSDDVRAAKGNVVVGPVTILRRGESLDSKLKSEALKKNGEEEMIVSGTERLGPDPEMVPKQIRIKDLKPFAFSVAAKPDMYAGSAFALSPSPSSLPLPSFSRKKQMSPVVDDWATKDLRRLLRLD
ncbi:hypothetical protein CK203_001422 [Vitis vinifera]|uniref:Uncharacterized protein n=1 Tax=Vitis vinifera TaxID=29760 RepID=A0A438F6U3_VITVI|nr:hypothetical protein CK203_105129 [Vitis vinifera]RVX22004.1 hypothetical protein CK203_001422 [Vitis vinifera]